MLKRRPTFADSDPMSMTASRNERRGRHAIMLAAALLIAGCTNETQRPQLVNAEQSAENAAKMNNKLREMAADAAYDLALQIIQLSKGESVAIVTENEKTPGHKLGINKHVRQNDGKYYDVIAWLSRTDTNNEPLERDDVFEVSISRELKDPNLHTPPKDQIESFAIYTINGERRLVTRKHGAQGAVHQETLDDTGSNLGGHVGQMNEADLEKSINEAKSWLAELQ